MTSFDEYRDSYVDVVEQSISFTGQRLSYFTEAKADLLLELLRAHLGDPGNLTVLDIGCGMGLLHSYIASTLGRVLGTDPSFESLRVARKVNQDCVYVCSVGTQLALRDDAVDVSLAVNVIHHLPQNERSSFVGELARVTRRGGLVALIEQNPLNPLTRLAMARCEFDRDAHPLTKRSLSRLVESAALAVCDARYFLFSWAEWGGRAWIEDHFSRLPLGAQYLIAARQMSE